MRADKIIEALGGPTQAGQRIARLVQRSRPLNPATISHWKADGIIPSPWDWIIQKHYRELNLKTYHLMDCSES
jgi:hypothetical protein